MRETDPYGKLECVIGSSDDFWCFDYIIHEDNTTTLHSVINSDTGAFIQDAEKPIRIPLDKAVDEAKRLINDALEWCAENNVKHDKEGWNQKPDKFVLDLTIDINRIQKKTNNQKQGKE